MIRQMATRIGITAPKTINNVFITNVNQEDVDVDAEMLLGALNDALRKYMVTMPWQQHTKVATVKGAIIDANTVDGWFSIAWPGDMPDAEGYVGLVSSGFQVQFQSKIDLNKKITKMFYEIEPDEFLRRQYRSQGHNPSVTHDFKETQNTQDRFRIVGALVYFYTRLDLETEWDVGSVSYIYYSNWAVKHSQLPEPPDTTGAQTVLAKKDDAPFTLLDAWNSAVTLFTYAIDEEATSLNAAYIKQAFNNFGDELTYVYESGLQHVNGAMIELKVGSSDPNGNGMHIIAPAGDYRILDGDGNLQSGFLTFRQFGGFFTPPYYLSTLDSKLKTLLALFILKKILPDNTLAEKWNVGAVLDGFDFDMVKTMQSLTASDLIGCPPSDAVADDGTAHPSRMILNATLLYVFGTWVEDDSPYGATIAWIDEGEIFFRETPYSFSEWDSWKTPISVISPMDSRNDNLAAVLTKIFIKPTAPFTPSANSLAFYWIEEMLISDRELSPTDPRTGNLKASDFLALEDEIFSLTMVDSENSINLDKSGLYINVPGEVPWYFISVVDGILKLSSSPYPFEKDNGWGIAKTASPLSAESFYILNNIFLTVITPYETIAQYFTNDKDEALLDDELLISAGVMKYKNQQGIDIQMEAAWLKEYEDELKKKYALKTKMLENYATGENRPLEGDY
jgi:hypothetical protein